MLTRREMLALSPAILAPAVLVSPKTGSSETLDDVIRSLPGDAVVILSARAVDGHSVWQVHLQIRDGCGLYRTFTELSTLDPAKTIRQLVKELR